MDKEFKLIQLNPWNTAGKHSIVWITINSQRYLNYLTILKLFKHGSSINI